MKKNFVTSTCVLILAIVSARPGKGAEMPEKKEYTNFIGMKFVRIEPGVFRMGVGSTPLPVELTADGTKKWQRGHREDGSHVLTVWGPDEKEKTRSVWRDKKLMSHKFMDK